MGKEGEVEAKYASFYIPSPSPEGGSFSTQSLRSLPTIPSPLSPISSSSFEPLSIPTPSPHQFLLLPNPYTPFPISQTTLPTPVRQRIIVQTSFSRFLTLSRTHPTSHTDIQNSIEIWDIVFNCVLDIHPQTYPPTAHSMSSSDQYFYPVFARAIP